MAKPVLAMEKEEVKAAIRRAGGAEMNCAVLLGDDKTIALFRMDPKKGPKILLGMLQADFPKAKSPAFGKANLAPDDEGTLLLTLNKVPPGATKRIKLALKGSGIKRVQIKGEDGSTDTEPDSDEDAEAAVGTAPAQAAATPDGAAPDLAALNERLRTLVGRTKDALAAQPDRKEELASRAGAAQSRLKAAEAAQDPEMKRVALGLAAKSFDAWEAVLGAAGQQGTLGGGTGKAPPAPSPERLQQFGSAWTMTRTRVQTSLTTLEQALAQQYGQTPLGPQVAAAFKARVAPVLAALDDRLDGKLAAAAKAASPTDRAQFTAEARQILKEHASYVAGEPLIRDLDANPFVKLEISKTVTATLDKLAEVMG